MRLPVVTRLADGYEVAVTQGWENVGEMCAYRHWGKGRRAEFDARINDPFGIPTRMPLDMEYLFVHGVEGPRKWMV